MENEITQVDTQANDQQVDSQTQNGGNSDAGQEQTPTNPYEARLRELEAEQARLKEELTKKDEIITRKEEVIRKSVKKPEPAPEFEDRFKALEQRLIEKDVREQINSLTSDQHERELAFRMYQDRIVKTGNIADDVKMAFGAANADLTLKNRQQVMEQEAYESSLASRASSHVNAPQASRSLKSPEYKMAESILDKIEPKAKEHLAKYLR